MSELHTTLVQQEMEESGEMDFIRDHVAAFNATKGEPATPAAEADTVEEEAVGDAESEGLPVTADLEDSAEEAISADAGTEPDAESDEETLYLELDDDVQALIDSKYGGDIGKALAALRESQSLIGRQGNELGQLRQEMQEWQAQMAQSLMQAQPYPEFPDEYADGPEAVAQLRRIAEAAYQREDADTFQTALVRWEDMDPVSAGLYTDLKKMEIAQAMLQQAPASYQDDEATLRAGVAEVFNRNPQLRDPAFQQLVNEELDKTPSLKAVLWEGVPGVTMQERLAVLEEAAQRVASRTTSETAQKARRRIAIRNSEEARAARVAAQVARGQTAREVVAEPEARTIPMGESGLSLNVDRLNSMLSPEDRI